MKRNPGLRKILIKVDLLAVFWKKDGSEFSCDKFEVHVRKIEEIGRSFNLTGFNNVRFVKLSQTLTFLHLVIKTFLRGDFNNRRHGNFPLKGYPPSPRGLHGRDFSEKLAEKS